MREVVFVNVGQAGVQIANAVWELFCIEHSIRADGFTFNPDQPNESDTFQTIFSEVASGKFVPRVVSVDLEPTVIDEVRTGCYRKLFHPDQLVSGYEDAANNYARGHFTMGRKIIDNCLNQIRKVAHACSNVQGFFLVDSLGGGTGSGFSILLNERLSVEYTKKPKFQFCVFPSPKMESSVVSPYNTVMHTHSSMDYIDLAIIMDNEATYDICVESLMLQRPTFNNINRLISQVLSSLTVSLRFENSLNSDLDQICTNLVPYPRIHFPTSHHAPMQCKSRIDHELSTEFDITRALFTTQAQFVKVDCTVGKLMACVMQYRGRVSPKNVNCAISEIKRRNDICFVDWCPTGFKVGINNFPPTVIPSSSMAQTSKSVTMLCNTTAICQIWEKLNSKFDFLFSKRAFVHWFVGEGMEEGEFNEGRYTVEAIIKDYQEAVLTEEEFINGVPNKYAIHISATAEDTGVDEEGNVIAAQSIDNAHSNRKASTASKTPSMNEKPISGSADKLASLAEKTPSMVDKQPTVASSHHTLSVKEEGIELAKKGSATSEKL